jgi:drug/metabolite transporter (DMT)-like permease
VLLPQRRVTTAEPTFSEQPPSACRIGRPTRTLGRLLGVSVFFAVLSTIAIGLGEFFAGGVAKRTRATEVTSTMFVSGVVMMALITAVWPGDPDRSDLAFGALAGVANGVGILLLYFAYSRGSVRSAAPAAAVVMSAVPIVWDVIVSGATPSVLSSFGIALGVVAIAVSSYEPDDSGAGRAGLATAIAGGAVFGALLILLSYIDSDAGGSALLVQRVVALVVAVSVTRATGPRIFPRERHDLATSALVGVFATAAILLFVLALRGGSLSVVSVVSSQYAAVAVLLGVVFRGQRMWWWQGLGLVGASLAVALIAVG